MPGKHPLRSFFHLLAAVFTNPFRFRREWNRYSGPAAGVQGIEGRWTGEWVSAANGHRGRLRVLMVKLQPGKYRASIHATYAKILRVCYRVALEGREAGGDVELDGDTDLGGLAGGVYHYHGNASPTGFHCDYYCKYDRGIFRLSRPA